MPVERVTITPQTETVVRQLQNIHGPLMFHQSGGCCDGSAPMCFAEGDFKTGGSDRLLGRVAGCDFFMSADQFEYWKHTRLTIDITKGRGSSFSLEIPMGIRFIIRSRLFTEAELEQLDDG